MNLGIAELWSIRFPEASRHLEEGLTLAQNRAALPGGRLPRPSGNGRPAHWTARLRRASAQRGGGRDRRDPRLGDRSGLSCGLRRGGQLLVRLGRFAEAERWLSGRSARSIPESPGRAGSAHLARPVGWPQPARGARRLSGREQMQALLAGEHALTAEVRNRILQIQLRIDETAAGPAALARVTTLPATAPARASPPPPCTWQKAIHSSGGRACARDRARGDGASPDMGSARGVAVRRRGARAARRQARRRGLDRTSARPRRAGRGHPAVRARPRARPARASPA